MKQETIKRIRRTVILCAAAMAIGGGIGLIQLGLEGKNNGTGLMEVAGADIGGPFTLVNQDGKTVTEKDYAGKYKLIYFGFTYCPAICPTELQKIAQTMNIIGEKDAGLAEAVQPLFVSVDPERDTAKVMREYVKLFHPRLVGLTGTMEQIEQVKKDYRIYAAKVKSETADDYTVDHSSFIYLMSPDDRLLGIYRAADSAETVAADLMRAAGK